MGATTDNVRPPGDGVAVAGHHVFAASFVRMANVAVRLGFRPVGMGGVETVQPPSQPFNVTLTVIVVPDVEVLEPVYMGLAVTCMSLPYSSARICAAMRSPTGFLFTG